METITCKKVSGPTNNYPILTQPDFAAIAWQQEAPDLMTMPYSQLKQLMQRAREYDPRAIELFSTLAEPIVKYYSCLPYVVSVLGKEEARSCANHTMMDFLMHEKLRSERQDIPTMLKRAIHCDLKNQIDRMKTRRQFEQYSTSDANSITGDDDDEKDVFARLPADPRLEPERQVLERERKRLIRKCMHYLSAKEKFVIEGIFFRQQSIAELAEELHCADYTVSQAKYSALKKLRELFKEKQIA